MREPVNVQIALGPALVVRDLAPDAFREDLRTAAGQGIQTGVHQLAQDPLVGHAVEIREERDLHRGETFQVNVGPDAFEAAEQIGVVVERQIRVQAVDDVDLGHRLIAAPAELVPGFLERHGVRPGVPRLEPREGAEQTAGDAHVGRFEADVVVVVGAAAVPLLAFAIGQPADRQQIGALEQTTPVVDRQPLAGVEPVRDVEEMRVREPRAHGPVLSLWKARGLQETPKIWMRSDRARGPSSSAIRMRCHCPSTTSPPLTCSVRL